VKQKENSHALVIRQQDLAKALAVGVARKVVVVVLLVLVPAVVVWVVPLPDGS